MINLTGEGDSMQEDEYDREEDCFYDKKSRSRRNMEMGNDIAGVEMIVDDEIGGRARRGARKEPEQEKSPVKEQVAEQQAP